VVSTIKKYTLESFSESAGISNVVKVERKSASRNAVILPDVFIIVCLVWHVFVIYRRSEATVILVGFVLSSAG